MNFKQEFMAALRSGAKHEALLGIVRRHYSGRSSAQAVYNALQEIWLELGFDKDGAESSLRDELEYVMEKAWFQCPA